MRMTPSKNLLVSSERFLCIFPFVIDAMYHTHTPFLVWSGCQMNSFLKLSLDSLSCRNCADHHYYHSDELEVLSVQGHNHSHHAASPLLPHQLSSLLMMQELGFQWSNCSFADTSSVPMNGQQDGHSKIKEEEPLNPRSSCAGTAAISYYHDIDGGGGGLPAMAAADLDGTVLPSVNISRPQQLKAWPAAPPPLPGDAFEILASSRLCKTLLLSQASSVLLHNGMPLLRSEHVPYGPPAAHPQGPSGDNYNQQVSQIEVQCSRVELACTVFFLRQN